MQYFLAYVMNFSFCEVSIFGSNVLIVYIVLYIHQVQKLFVRIVIVYFISLFNACTREHSVKYNLCFFNFPKNGYSTLLINLSKYNNFSIIFLKTIRSTNNKLLQSCLFSFVRDFFEICKFYILNTC